MFSLHCGMVSDRGKIREKNEDAQLVQTQNKIKLLAVADGLGGHQGGEVASNLALQILDTREMNGPNLEEDLKAAFFMANKEILKRSLKDPGLAGMGTTLTALAINGEKGIIGHIGDSRLYLYRDFQLQQITRDHTLVNELVKKGNITEKEAYSHPQRNLLLQALGLEEEIDLDLKEIDVKENDIFLLCTDGLTGLLKDKEIKELIDDRKDMQFIAQEMVKEANLRGGHDNITVVLCRIERQ